MSTNRVIVGMVRDINPSQSERLELHFGEDARSRFPSGERVHVAIEIGETKWIGTMNTANPTNPPYFHTNFTSDQGSSSMTELLDSVAVGHGGRIAFTLMASSHLRFDEVLDRGGVHPKRTATG